jgi:UDPglucose 6-dehydrogenase
MRVNVVGVGKLGLAYAAFISSRGHIVHCVDNNTELIAQYTSGYFETTEPKVADLVHQFPMTYSTECVEADLTIILVNTPTSYAGYDHRNLEHVLTRVSGQVILTSTVQPGFCQRYPDLTYNPLFVQIGDVIHNLESTHDVLVGGTPGIHRDFFTSLYGTDVCIHYMSHIEAEVAKLSLNSFITMKISFANMIGDALRRVGKDADAVLSFVGSDARIGPKCFKYGWGYGGPCFPRDNRALSTFLREQGMYDYLPMASHESNERHAMEQALFYDSPVMSDMCYKDNCAVPITEESHKVKTALILKTLGKNFTIQYPSETLPKELHPFCQM